MSDSLFLQFGWGASHLAMREAIFSLPDLPPESVLFLWTPSQKKLIEGEREEWRNLARYLDYKQAKSIGFSVTSPLEKLESEPAKKLIEVKGELLFTQLEAIIGGWDVILEAGLKFERHIPYQHPRDFFVEAQREISFSWGRDIFSPVLTEGGRKYWSNLLREETVFLEGRHKNQDEILESFKNKGLAEFWLVAILDFLQYVSRNHTYRTRYWNPLLKAQKRYRNFVLKPQKGYQILHPRFKDGSVFLPSSTGGKTLEEKEVVSFCNDFVAKLESLGHETHKKDRD